MQLPKSEQLNIASLSRLFDNNAWYMVTEYHLNLGPRDNLEKLSITFPVLQLCCLMRNSRRFWTGGSRVRIWL